MPFHSYICTVLLTVTKPRLYHYLGANSNFRSKFEIEIIGGKQWAKSELQCHFISKFISGHLSGPSLLRVPKTGWTASSVSSVSFYRNCFQGIQSKLDWHQRQRCFAVVLEHCASEWEVNLHWYMFLSLRFASPSDPDTTEKGVCGYGLGEDCRQCLLSVVRSSYIIIIHHWHSLTYCTTPPS